MGGFLGGYKVNNGIVYGSAGGVADLRVTPPRQLGSFNVNSVQGNQSIEGSGVAPDPAVGRVFFTGFNLTNSNSVLLSYDTATYELVNMAQFSGSAQSQDLLRWGRDGLAWHSSLSGFGISTPGKGQLILMRGPLVLPQWASTNVTPTLASVSPSSATAAAGANITLSVTGTNFVPGAVVLWNNNERTTTFVDSTHLSVAIPASDLSQSGTATLVVNNPGSSNSSSVSFTVN
jgi:hypothetical protein